MSNESEIREVQKAATKDPVNITVYGNPILDVILRVGPYATNAAAMRALKQIARISPDGTIEFEADSYIICYLQKEEFIFGPLNPHGRMDALLPGGKYVVPFTIGRLGLTPHSGKVTTLVAPELRLGGGGANVLNGFFDVFAQLKVQFIATVENTQADGRLDPFIKALTDVVGMFDPIQLYQHPGVNLAIEGLGFSNDRTILVAGLPDEAQLDDTPRPMGKSIMVNTLYSARVAIDALAHTLYGDRLGVLALTKSLCSKKPIPQTVQEQLRGRHAQLLSSAADGSINSVYEFIKTSVLPRGKCICIMNEDELEHITEVDFFVKRNKTRVPVFASLLRAMRKFREFQQGARHRVYVTVGHWGSFVLDEYDHLIYCGTYNDVSRVPFGKTAIGDTYATFVLALETIGNYIRPYVIPAWDVMRAAAAGADATVYEGFGLLSVAKVNRYIGERSRLVADLGPIEAIPLEHWEMGMDELRESDYQKLARRNLEGSAAIGSAGTLQEVIGRAFLRT
jgi:hypothetical protein